jgi:anti-anti-sigma factor
MSNGSPTAKLSIWAGEQFVVVRINGRANFQSSVDFKATLLELWQRGATRFILDLTDCQLMDSTFLGVMAGLGLRFSKEPNRNGTATIELLNASSRVQDLFDNLGILGLFQLCRTPGPDLDRDLAQAKTVEVTQAPHPAPDRKETTRVCLEAHKLLMQLNEANVAKFKDVTKFLEEDLKRMEGSAPAPGERQP